MAPDLLDPKRRDRLFRIATRLGQVAAGSRLADQSIHHALQLPGDPPPYTTAAAAAALLVPPGFEIGGAHYAAAMVTATVRRAGLAADGQRHPAHSQYAVTLPLALAGAALRAQTAAANG